MTDPICANCGLPRGGSKQAKLNAHIVAMTLMIGVDLDDLPLMARCWASSAERCKQWHQWEAEDRAKAGQ